LIVLICTISCFLYICIMFSRST